MEERVGGEHELPCADVVRAQEAIRNLERWQKDQNGHLCSIDCKLDGMKAWLIGLLGSMVLALVLLVIILLKDAI
jgi:hypothetical protein